MKGERESSSAETAWHHGLSFCLNLAQSGKQAESPDRPSHCSAFSQDAALVSWPSPQLSGLAETKISISTREARQGHAK